MNTVRMREGGKEKQRGKIKNHDEKKPTKIDDKGTLKVNMSICDTQTLQARFHNNEMVEGFLQLQIFSNSKLNTLIHSDNMHF